MGERESERETGRETENRDEERYTSTTHAPPAQKIQSVARNLLHPARQPNRHHQKAQKAAERNKSRFQIYLSRSGLLIYLYNGKKYSFEMVNEDKILHVNCDYGNALTD